MNVVNMQPMESSLAFKPIEDDSSMEYEKIASSTEIFRDTIMEDPLMSSSHVDKPYTVCRAQPIDSSESEDQTTERRVISPFTHSTTTTTSWDEREDREKLTPLDWSSSSEMIGEHPCIIDFSLLFEPNTFASNMDLMDCNNNDNDDDFSLSSHEATSMCQHVDFESISDDPSSFWESGASVEISLDRSSSPNDISFDHSE